MTPASSSARMAPTRPLTLHRATDHPPGRLAREARAGRLVTLRPGWYSEPVQSEQPVWQERQRQALDTLHALAATLGPNDVVTGAHAALLHGFALPTLPEAVAIAGPSRGSQLTRTPHLRRLTRALADHEVVVIDGIAVTGVTRTIVEAARLLDPRDALRVADALLHQGAAVNRFDREASEYRLADLRRQTSAILARERGYSGNPQARIILSHADGFAESPWETEARRLCLVIGLPRPELQVPVETREGLYFSDASWRVTRGDREAYVHLECDGWVKYGEAQALDAERLRQAAIEELGHTVVRVSADQLRRDGQAHLRRWLLPRFPREVLTRLDPVTALDGERLQRLRTR